MYGVSETNGVDSTYHNNLDFKGKVSWTARNLKVTRLRLLSDPGFPYWDVSYCHGKIAGKDVRVELPFHQLPKNGYKKAIVAYAKKDGVYAKGIGILDAISTLC